MKTSPHLAGRIAFALLIALACLGLFRTGFAQAQTASPTLDLAMEPLFTGRGNVHPNLVLDLSVEYPTAGAAYRGTNTPDDSYSSANEYVGYFNPDKCYRYSKVNNGLYLPSYLAKDTAYYSSGSSPVYKLSNLDPVTGAITGTPAGYKVKGTGASAYAAAANEIFQTASFKTTSFGVPDLSDDGYFEIDGNATNRECTAKFSGNFLNWAASSAIDMLRYALSGGDRVIDETGRTVLQRAYLPDDKKYNSNEDFYAHSTYFPRKKISGTTANKATPFGSNTIYIVSCRNKVLFGNSSSGTSCDAQRYSISGASASLVGSTDKYYGEYLARVKVCDSNEGPTRTDLCGKYGSNYKPEGNLQRYSDKMRAAAFGYLTGSHVDNLYGGVLRAPMKYVGPSKFVAPRFAKASNDQSEWNADTGVFLTNPLGSASGSSGVINYLNKFGRTDSSRLGAYKTKDPVSELYYESLRYLQGKQPTNGSSDATSAIKLLGGSTTDSNFPVEKTWTDPVVAACQSNYIVVIGDVNTHQDGYIPDSSADGVDANRTDDTSSGSKTWPAITLTQALKDIASMETGSATGTLAGNKSPDANLSNLHSRTNAGSSNGTFNMAGLAYWANTNDIRSDTIDGMQAKTRVKTFAIDVDEGGDGKMDGNKRGIQPRRSAFYLAAKYGGFLDKGDSEALDANLQPDKNPFRTIGSDGKTIVYDQSEWTGTANGTDPSNYFLASQPEKMIAAIKSIFQLAATNSGTISGVTLTSTKISTNDATSDTTYVYQPGFDQSKWSGSLLKLKVSLDANNKVQVASPSAKSWDAGDKLANQAASDRTIYTSYINPTTGGIEPVEFKWSSFNEEMKKTFLGKSTFDAASDDPDGTVLVNYLRGDRSKEIGQANGYLRARDRVLGDIINSNPTWVGAPATYMQGDGYLNFYNSKVNRTKAVYVGANDGMLHAFNADSGNELFAYVPAAVMSKLKNLTDPGYAHDSYVDGTMNVAEAYIKTGQTATGAAYDWKTLLVSGMGAGAQGVFSLDVTNPSNFDGGLKALWEFTDKNDPDMGNVYSPPVIAKFKELDADEKVVYKNYVVVSNGFNSSKDDSGAQSYSCPTIKAGDAIPTGSVCNANGLGALFLLSLDKGKTEGWKESVNYRKFTTPALVGKEVSGVETMSNGLSAPALVVGSDGAVRYAYAGDLRGNLWRFDFTKPKKGGGWDSVRAYNNPLFKATDGTNPQPITQEPKVVFGPGGGYVVLFGTGKFVEKSDTSSSGAQSFYAVWDTLDDLDGTGDTVTRSQLAKRTAVRYTTGGKDAMTISGDSFIYGAKKGWYLDFYNSSSTGERSVTNALTAYGNLFFNTLMISNPCEKGGGRSYAMCALSGFPLSASGYCDSGGVTGYISTVGMLSSPVLFTTETTVGDRDSIGERNVSKKYSVYNFGTGGVDGTAKEAYSGTAFVPRSGRSGGWREVLNWQDLKAAAQAAK